MKVDVKVNSTILEILKIRGDLVSESDIFRVFGDLRKWASNKWVLNINKDEIIQKSLKGEDPFSIAKTLSEASVVPFTMFEKMLRNDLSLLEEVGLISTNADKYILTDEGHAALDRLHKGRALRHRKKQPKTVFVASAIGREDVDRLYELSFLPVCERLGCNVIRIDRDEPEQTITDAIIDRINNCSAVIVDLTYARQSVYFEAGYALGMGIPIMLTCRKDHYKGQVDSLRIHFDLEQFKISLWVSKDQLFIWSENMDPESRLKAIISRDEI